MQHCFRITARFGSRRLVCSENTAGAYVEVDICVDEKVDESPAFIALIPTPTLHSGCARVETHRFRCQIYTRAASRRSNMQ